MRPYSPPVEKSFLEKFSFTSLTSYVTTFDVLIYLLTILTLVYFVITYAEGADLPEEYSWECVLYYWGAKHTPSIRYNFHLHRLLFPAILHGSVLHILGNMIVQVYYGFVLEVTHGWWRVSVVYIGGALGGSLLSCIVFPYQIAVGASAAIFALLALELVYFITHFPVIEKKR